MKKKHRALTNVVLERIAGMRMADLQVYTKQQTGRGITANASETSEGIIVFILCSSR